MQYRADIDGLRTLAVMPVLVFHSGLGLSGGYVGVDIFFVISGFLITSIIFAEAREGRFTILGFYERRIRRIIPALFTVILVTGTAASFVMIPGHLEDLALSGIASAFFYANFWQYFSQGYFTEAAELKPLLHTWSLGIEEQFYIFFPPLFVLMFTRLGGAKTTLGLWLVVLISLALSVWAVGANPDAAFYLPQYRIWELALGSLLAVALAERSLDRVLQNRGICSALAAAGLILIAWPVITYGPETQFPGLAALPPCLGAAALIAAGSHVQTPVSWFLGLGPMVGIGKISYSLYLWHWPVISLFTYVNIEPLNTAQGILCIALSFGLSYLSWRYVERPFRQKHLVSRRQIFAGFGVASAIVLAAAVTTASYKGFPARMPADVVALLDRQGLLHDRRDCHRVLPERARKGDVCVRGDLSAQPSFMLVGDSHADAISPAIFAAAEMAGVSGYQYTDATGLLPLIGVTRPGRPDWSDTLTAFAEFLRERPDIRTLIVTRYWLVQMTGYSYRHQGQIWRDEEYDGSGSAYNVNATVAGMDKFVRAFPELRIVLLDDIPTGDELDLRTHVRFLLYGNSHQMSRLGLDPAEERRQRDSYEPVLRALAARHGKVEYVSLFQELCTETSCPLFSGDTPLYRDGDHLSHDGALRLTQVVYDRLFTAPTN
ncbi:acyltransferase family protein [Roseovarius sp. CAU 1744]|uniref:acyltransferase family protein n=1 Tax=Roseovarius sp. CAU 1744 TaxID=3140368 RepID=UPI00325B2FC9